LKREERLGRAGIKKVHKTLKNV